METQWIISKLERKSDNGFVVAIYYKYIATSGSYSSDSYGTVYYTQESENFIPFEQLNKTDVINWLTGSINVVELNQILKNRIEEQINPKVVDGFPNTWNN